VPADALITVVQVIRVHWTKRSRGDSAAALRARAPRAAALAAPTANPAGRIRVDELTIGEPDFQATRTTTRYADPADLPTSTGVRLHREGDLLRVRFEYPPDGGLPARSKVDASGTRVPLTEHCFTLPAGAWGRVEWNGRRTAVGTGAWSYHLTTVNIAFGRQVAVDVFLASPPVAVHSQLADLR